ncbi:RNA-directed DNA polymerase from mobile element jockey [Trichonephila clavata]|uniref:RNA-directed DNA polymerase from mobile element jockey n=1 Tax=Trichonephila clavata TaxID=2740835 RepID=A0A8X6M7G0_TRICU|nr:RNA-directed DNA polymerase from mobile element jockey [Trichonephila clavata]
MTSCANESWSERTDDSTPMTSTPNLGAKSPSQALLGDDYIAENSDLFRETIKARNVYAAWARKLTQAKPQDPALQSYHLELSKSGEIVSNLLLRLQVPLFKIPATEKILDRIVLRVRNKSTELPSKNHEEKTETAATAAVPPPLSSSPMAKNQKRRKTDADGFSPPAKHLIVRKPRSRPSPTPPTAPAPSIEGVVAEEAMEETQTTISQPATVPEKKPRVPPFFVNPKGDWRQLIALAKIKAPALQSVMTGRFLKVTVANDVEHRALNAWLEETGVEFKTFTLKQDRPVKVVIRGLPSNTEPEEIKEEIEAEGKEIMNTGAKDKILNNDVESCGYSSNDFNRYNTRVFWNKEYLKNYKKAILPSNKDTSNSNDTKHHRN